MIFYFLINFLVVRVTEELMQIPGDFYLRVKEEFNRRPVTTESVTGTIGNYSELDINASLTFIQDIMSGPNSPGTKLALDCGAGYGRVTQNILIKYFDKVDMVEQSEKFAKAALEYVDKEHLGTIYKIPVQDFYPAHMYDMVWIQGILMYLTDEDSIVILSRCRKALTPKGIIIIRENIATDGYDYYSTDPSSPSVARTFKLMINIIQKAGLIVIKYDFFVAPVYQPDHMFAVVPKEVEHLYSDMREEYTNAMLERYSNVMIKQFKSPKIEQFSNAPKIKPLRFEGVILICLSFYYLMNTRNIKI